MCKLVSVLTDVLCPTLCRAMCLTTKGVKQSNYDMTLVTFYSTYYQLGCTRVRSGSSRLIWTRKIGNTPENDIVCPRDIIEDDAATFAKVLCSNMCNFTCAVQHVHWNHTTTAVQWLVNCTFHFNTKQSIVQFGCISCVMACHIWQLVNSCLIRKTMKFFCVMCIFLVVRMLLWCVYECIATVVEVNPSLIVIQSFAWWVF